MGAYTYPLLTEQCRDAIPELYMVKASIGQWVAVVTLSAKQLSFWEIFNVCLHIPLCYIPVQGFYNSIVHGGGKGVTMGGSGASVN